MKATQFNLKVGKEGSFYVFPCILKPFLYVLSQYSLGLKITDKSQLGWNPSAATNCKNRRKVT